MDNEVLPPSTEEDVEVHYDITTDSWITRDGAAVCQDHAVREPCEFTHSRHMKGL